MTLELVEGWTEPINALLRANGAPRNLTGATVTIHLYRDGVVFPVVGSVTILDALTGSVEYVPDAADLVAGTYTQRWKVIDVLGEISYHPSGQANVWRVRAIGEAGS